MIKSLSAAAIAISLIAGPALAQGNVPVTEPIKTQQGIKPAMHKPHVHTTAIHKASAHKVRRHVAHRHATHRHVAHVKNIDKHGVGHVAKHVKHAKPVNSAKRIKHQDKVNTAG